MAKKRTVIDLVKEYDQTKDNIEQENVSVNMNNQLETEADKETYNTINQEEASGELLSETELPEGAAAFLAKANAVKHFKRQQTVEETHTRQTYLINNNLLKRFNKIAKGKDKGFKTRVINSALEVFLDELEKH